VSGHAEHQITQVTLHLVNGAIGLNGPIGCPACGERHILTVSVLLDETGDDPSYVRCSCGAVWEESGLPRRLLAEVLNEAAALDPEAWEELRFFTEHHGPPPP
jgi:hypothetical protein